MANFNTGIPDNLWVICHRELKKKTAAKGKYADLCSQQSDGDFFETTNRAAKRVGIDDSTASTVKITHKFS